MKNYKSNIHIGCHVLFVISFIFMDCKIVSLQLHVLFVVVSCHSLVTMDTHVIVTPAHHLVRYHCMLKFLLVFS